MNSYYTVSLIRNDPKPAEEGEFMTCALLQCDLCGGTISSSGGGGGQHAVLCIPCGDALESGNLRWRGLSSEE